MTMRETTKPSSKRLLWVIDTLGVGGVESSLKSVLPALIKQGWTVDVASLMAPYHLAQDLQASSLFKLDLSHRWNLPEAVWKLNRLVRRNHYDVIQTGVYFSTNYGAWIGHPCRVAAFAGLEFDRNPMDSLWYRTRTRWRKRWLRQYEGIMGASQAVCEHYQAHLQIPKMECIAYPVKEALLDFQSTQSRAEILGPWCEDSSHFIFVMPARLIPAKAHDVLLKAMVKLGQTAVEFEVLLFGDGPLRAEVEQRISSLGLGQRVKLHAALDQKALFPILSHADAFLLPSRSEGFGLALLEAMALGCPVIGTDSGGIKDLIEDQQSGLLIEKENPQALSEAMRSLMEDKALCRLLKENAKRRVRTHFSEAAVGQKLDAFYQGLVNRASSSLR